MTYLSNRHIGGMTGERSLGFPFEHYPGILRRIGKSIWRAIKIGRQRRALHELSDEMLKDIGLNRSAIDYVAEGLVDGRIDWTRRWHWQ